MTRKACTAEIPPELAMLSTAVSSTATRCLQPSRTKDSEQSLKITPSFCFNRVTEPVSETAATQIGVKFSDRAFEDIYWTYNEEDGMYHTDHFENDLKREKLLVLSDETEYIVKEGYEGPGSAGSVTYCDYKLKGR